MIARTTRRGILQSSSLARAANNNRQQGRNTILGSEFVGYSPFAFHPPNSRCMALSSLSPLQCGIFHSEHRKYNTKVITNENDDDQCQSPALPSRFENLNLHPKTLEALKRQGIHKLTEVQGKTHSIILNGDNLVARSRTGTGKTLAFLVPCIERILQSERNNEVNTGIPILILAPTRELAAQIGKEAEKIFALHNDVSRSERGGNKKLLSSQVVYGGSSRKEDVQRFQDRLPTILVATPGRLKDHL